MAQRSPGREYIPPVQTLQVRYAKRGRMRFASHRDFQRVWERALRRVGAPMAYSAGFSPHPKVSYAGAAPTGAASDAEYLEIALVQRVDPESVRSALDAALPEGLDLVAVVEAEAPLAQQLRASRWRMQWPVDITEAVAAFEQAESVEIERVTKGGRRTIDVRALCSDIELVDSRTLEVTVTHAEPTPRPVEVAAALRAVWEDLADVPVLGTRLAQGEAVPGGVRSAF